MKPLPQGLCRFGRQDVADHLEGLHEPVDAALVAGGVKIHLGNPQPHHGCPSAGPCRWLMSARAQPVRDQTAVDGSSAVSEACVRNTCVQEAGRGNLSQYFFKHFWG